MSVRKIIEIDKNLCNGCGLCIPNCPEGALQVIDGKARLISDLFCDGLGACIGECPQEAIKVIERDAVPYDEVKVMENIVRQGKNVIKAHLKHLKDHNETALLKQAELFLEKNDIENPMKDESEDTGNKNRLPCGCPGSRVMDFSKEDKREIQTGEYTDTVQDKGTKNEQIEKLLRKLTEREPKLRQWPVQIALIPPEAPYFKDADILVAADCVPFAYPAFHEDFLEGKILLIGCPKLDDSQFYLDKITQILKSNNIKSITVAHMEVPCCLGMLSIVRQAVKNSGKNIPVEAINVGIKGKVISKS